ncbi:MAG: hypothetical protein ACLFSC_05050 [Wenzhouxiangella sp.]
MTMPLKELLCDWLFALIVVRPPTTTRACWNKREANTRCFGSSRRETGPRHRILQPLVDARQAALALIDRLRWNMVRARARVARYTLRWKSDR